MRRSDGGCSGVVAKRWGSGGNRCGGGELVHNKLREGVLCRSDNEHLLALV
jgi:hypothetical protein